MSDLFKRELLTSATIGRDGRVWLNGQLFPFYLDPTGPALAAGSQGGTKVLALPVLALPELLYSNLRQEER